MSKLLLICTLTLIVSCSTNQKKVVPKVEGQSKTDVPPITTPSVNCFKTEDKIDDGGKKWEQGHLICIIEKQSTWSK